MATMAARRTEPTRLPVQDTVHDLTSLEGGRRDGAAQCAKRGRQERGRQEAQAATGRGVVQALRVASRGSSCTSRCAV